MKLTELVRDKKSCCGCGACQQACPSGAISLVPDEYGFIYPAIDEAACVDCGSCIAACQYHHAADTRMPLEAYAAYGKDEKLIENSASGGLFAALAKSLTENGGAAAGAVMETDGENLRVLHKLEKKADSLRAMQGSKYVQSEAHRCYGDVLEELGRGGTVLFSGTPCQVAAIKKLSGDPGNLLTMDLVCHGVPSQKMLTDYLNVLGKRLGGPVTGLNFRNKSINKNYCASFEAGGKYLVLKSQFLSFYSFFLEGAVFRDSCYSCPYAKMKRTGDLTIGDYWGIDELHGADIESGAMPKRNDWSCLLVNSEKGRHFMNENTEALRLFPTKAQWIAKNNRQLNQPHAMPEERARIMDIYARKGYPALEKYYIERFGGKFVFYRRMLKNILQNHKSTVSERNKNR